MPRLAEMPCEGCKGGGGRLRGIVLVDGNSRDVLKTHSYNQVKTLFHKNIVYCDQCVENLMTGIGGLTEIR